MLVLIALNKTLNVDENFTFEDFQLYKFIPCFIILTSERSYCGNVLKEVGSA